MTQAELQAFYEDHIKDADAEDLANEIYELSGDPAVITDGIAKHMNGAVIGKDVKDDIVKLSMLIRAYNDLVEAAAEDVPADTSTRLSALETETATRFRYVGKSFTLGESADNIIDNGVYFSGISEEYPNGEIADIPTPMGWLEVTRNPTNAHLVLQVFYPYVTNGKKAPSVRFRKIDDTWTNWITITDTSIIRYIGKPYSRGVSADSIIDSGTYFSSITTDYPNGTISNLPYGMGWLEVTRHSEEQHLVLQIFYPYYTSGNVVPKCRFRKLNDAWSDWVSFGENVVINYTIEQNEYNVTATPTISTGVPYVLTSTGDTTDRTADIAAVLTANGACQLGTGTFYVKNLSIGEGQSLYGSGTGATIIRMIEDETGAAVSLGSSSSISDLTIDGGLTAGSTPSTNGGRHGLAWHGTYISPDSTGTSPYRGQISNIKIYGFSGAGIICTNTSMAVSACLNAVNINIFRCWCGVYIPIYSEYHRFTNIEVDGCYYGVINNGGNNMFVNCGFNSNQVGFYIDNSSNQSPNNSHGSAVGCTFNHSGSNAGTAVKLDGVSSGYVFSGCQIFYGGLDIKNSIGVNFSACNFGSSVPITINGGGLVLFANDIFIAAPSATKTNSPIVASVGCYLRDGTTATV